MTTALFTPKPIANDANLCGEGPLYDPTRNCVFWVDIDGGKLFRLDCATQTHQHIYIGDPVGGFTLQENGDLLLFRVKDIARLNPDTGEVATFKPFSDEGAHRFNDTSAGPAGHCYAGTIGKKNDAGGLFLLSPNGDLKLLFRGTGCANGMGWSPDRKTMYWTCSTRALIFAYDFDAATGEMTNERVLVTADRAKEGTPDGLSVDARGNLWSARWGGRGIYLYTPDGTFIRKVDLPVSQVTSLCFAGKDLTDVYITSAARGDTSSNAGSLFHMKSDTPGQLDFRSKIKVT